MYLVHTRFTDPVLPAEEAAQITAREAATAADLQHRRVLQHLWREEGTRNSWSVWDLSTESELRQTLSTLPWSAHMTFDITRIVPHPNALDAPSRGVEEKGQTP